MRYRIMKAHRQGTRGSHIFPSIICRFPHQFPLSASPSGTRVLPPFPTLCSNLSKKKKNLLSDQMASSKVDGNTAFFYGACSLLT